MDNENLPTSSKPLWTPDLLFGIPEIDREHRMLIESMEDLLRHANDSDQQQRVKRTLRFLQDYTNMHFEHEEALLEELDYPAIEDHKKLHITFCERIEKLDAELYQGMELQQSIAQLRFLLYTWYTNHIKNTDKQYVPLLQQKRAEKVKSVTYKLWKENLVLGIPEIDREHQALVELLEDLIHCIRQKSHHIKSILSLLLRFIPNYTRMHFVHEEEMLEQIHYPDMENHKELHNQFRIDIVPILQQASNNPESPATLQKIESVLVKWFIDHICIEDAKCVPYLKK